MLSEIAFHWKKMGIATIPIFYKDKRPKIKWQEYQKTMPTDTELQTWFSKQLTNIAVITGWSGLVVLDFDDMSAYSQWLMWATRTGAYTEYVAQNTYQVRTGRGVHVYIRLPHPEQNKHLNKIDIKANGGYVLVPPSIHPSGKSYSVINSRAIILSIEALSDILPASVLTQHTELPPGITSPVRSLPASDDPWVVAQSAGLMSPGEDVISKVRKAYRIEQFFSNLEKTSRDGRWMVTLCPFHEDHTPSFWLDTEKQICACYAGCTPKPLDVINLYGRLHGLSNVEAIHSLAKSL